MVVCCSHVHEHSPSLTFLKILRTIQLRKFDKADSMQRCFLSAKPELFNHWKLLLSELSPESQQRWHKRLTVNWTFSIYRLCYEKWNLPARNSHTLIQQSETVRNSSVTQTTVSSAWEPKQILQGLIHTLKFKKGWPGHLPAIWT